jgi:hypothetical protein
MYRFNRNDPVNLPRTDVYDTLTAWLGYFDFDLARLSAPVLDPNKILGLEPPRVDLPCYLTVSCSPQQDQLLGK